ncbi:hypothetical protein PC116_g13286 [Phytophthora cactorum]|nr:hypothetical protein PC116_g13286 [Phytophthora cactorum]
MKSKAYRPIGTAYINGRAYRLAQKGKNASLFQIRWLDSHFQSAVEHISVAIVQQGIKDNVSLTRVKNPDWRILVRPDPTDEIDCDGGSSDCGEEEVLEAFDPSELLPTILQRLKLFETCDASLQDKLTRLRTCTSTPTGRQRPTCALNSTIDLSVQLSQASWRIYISTFGAKFYMRRTNTLW